MDKKKYFCEVKFCHPLSYDCEYYVLLALQKFLKFENCLIEDKQAFFSEIEKIKEYSNFYLKNTSREINVAVVDLNDYVNVFVSDHEYDMLFLFCLHGIKNS